MGWYLKPQFKAFKDGVRGGAGDVYGAQTRPIALTLGDAAIDNGVAYIHTLSAPSSAATIQGGT